VQEIPRVIPRKIRPIISIVTLSAKIINSHPIVLDMVVLNRDSFLPILLINRPAGTQLIEAARAIEDAM
jgi:hypothetical protein